MFLFSVKFKETTDEQEVAQVGLAETTKQYAWLYTNYKMPLSLWAHQIKKRYKNSLMQSTKFSS